MAAAARISALPCSAAGLPSSNGTESDDVMQTRAYRILVVILSSGCAVPSPPETEDELIWRGRRLAYAGRIEEAIAVYSEGLERYQGSDRLLRHRGHRWISKREFGRAVADLSRAAELARGQPDELEPDGQPNPSGIPRSTRQSNIYYHLGLAHYLRREFEPALAAYDECLRFAQVNDDMLVATTYWRWLTLQRLGRVEQARASLAAVSRSMEILENHGYWRLLLAFQAGDVGGLETAAEKDPVQVGTLGYGIGCWHWCAGRNDAARAAWRQVVERASPWSFGRIAAEVALREAR
jgi:tetratricopeptide (TPR) repeat protein